MHAFKLLVQPAAKPLKISVLELNGFSGFDAGPIASILNEADAMSTVSPELRHAIDALQPLPTNAAVQIAVDLPALTGGGPIIAMRLVARHLPFDTEARIWNSL